MKVHGMRLHKVLWVSVCLSLFHEGILGQGVIRLSNLGQNGISVSQPIFDGETGLPIAGPGFSAQLYWASQAPNSPSDLAATDSMTGFFAEPIGILVPSFGQVPAEPGTYWLQVRVWENSFGNSYEIASTQVGAKVGASNIFTAQTVLIGQDFPEALVEAGMESFSLMQVSSIPEPSSIILISFGGIILVLRGSLDR